SKAWPSSSATTSTVERALPSSAVQLRCWSRPMTTTRLPLLSSASSHPGRFDIGGAGGGLAGSLAGGVHDRQGQLGSGDQDLSLTKSGPLATGGRVRDEVV